MKITLNKNSTNPIYALIDHLNNVSYSNNINYFKSFEDSFAACVEMYGIDELKEFFKNGKFDKTIQKRMKKILSEIDIVGELSDHNEQSYIESQDELNKISVAE